MTIKKKRNIKINQQKPSRRVHRLQPGKLFRPHPHLTPSPSPWVFFFNKIRFVWQPLEVLSYLANYFSFGNTSYPEQEIFSVAEQRHRRGT